MTTNVPDRPRAERHLGTEDLPGGRRVIAYDPLLALKIVERVAHGETLTKICDTSQGMPSYFTFHKWVLREPDLAKAYGAARVLSAQVFEDTALDKAREVADEPTSAPKVRAFEVLINQLRWSAEKRDPQQYSPKAAVNVRVPIQIITSLGLDKGGAATTADVPGPYKVTATVEGPPPSIDFTEGEFKTLAPPTPKPKWRKPARRKQEAADAPVSNS